MLNFEKIFGLVFFVCFAKFEVALSSGGGIKGAIKETALLSFFYKNNDKIKRLLSNIKFPGKDLDQESELQLYDIEARITNYSPDFIQIKFVNNDTIQITINYLKASGTVRARTNKWFHPIQEKVLFSMLNIKFDCGIKLKTLKKFGKLNIFGKPNWFNINYELDHDFLASPFSSLFHKFEKCFGENIDLYLATLKQEFIEAVNNIIPTYIFSSDPESQIEITHNFPPMIEKSFLLFNLDGTLLNPTTNEEISNNSTNNYIMPNIEQQNFEYDEQGKQVQLYFSYDLLNGWFENLYSLNYLNFTLTSNTYFDKIVEEMKRASGENNFIFFSLGINYNYALSLEPMNKPVASFDGEGIIVTLPASIKLAINKGSKELFLKMEGKFAFKIKFELKFGSIILKASNTKLVEHKINYSSLPSEDLSLIGKNLELFNLLSQNLLNDIFKNSLELKISALENCIAKNFQVDQDNKDIKVSFNLYFNKTVFEF